jgi:hypothetical protein
VYRGIPAGVLEQRQAQPARERPLRLEHHHIAEAIFKALGQAMAAAVRIVGTEIPSTKGQL